MKLTFRWYGPMMIRSRWSRFRQIPTHEQASSPPCTTSPPAACGATKALPPSSPPAAAHRLAFEVVESVPVAEDIKLGTARSRPR